MEEEIEIAREITKELTERMGVEAETGEKAKITGHAITAGPFNARDRRIIHMALKDDLSLKTESLGEGEMKKIAIVPS